MRIFHFGALLPAAPHFTEKQLAKYFVSRRKNCKPRFDHWRFAEDQNISTDWLFDGDIRAYPKSERRNPARAGKPGAVSRRRGCPAQPQQWKASAQRREQLEMAKSLTDDQASASWSTYGCSQRKRN
jgi:hypothetical protein